MDKPVTTISIIEQNIMKSYRGFFELEPENEPLMMPTAQVSLFITQAYQKHYCVALRILNQEDTVQGFVTHKLNDDIILVRAPLSKIDHIVRLSTCTYVHRLSVQLH